MVDNLDKAKSLNSADTSGAAKIIVDAGAIARKAVERSKIDVGNGWIKVRWGGGTRLVLPNEVRVKFIDGEAITRAKYWDMLQAVGVEFVEIDSSGHQELY